MDTSAWSGWPARPGGLPGFSVNASMVWPSAAACATPKLVAAARGIGTVETVTPAPRATCWSIICSGSMR